MSKVIAYCPLHYGKCYLDAAIRAVDPFVEKIVILYTSKPSYGYGTSMECPDSEIELKEIAFNASTKIQWENITAFQENQHRGLIYKYAQDGNYDGILTFDADEILEPNDIQGFIDTAMASDKRYTGVDGYLNYWKSFNHVCIDSFRPIRFINLHRIDGQGEARCRIYHFSTAQRMDIMRYKLEIHGHRAELRPNWLKEVYEAWTPTNGVNDLHLVAFGVWPQAIEFDKTTLPDLLKAHKNFNLDVIL